MNIADITEELSFVPSLRTRAMFGGHGVYTGDQIFAIVVDGELFLKGDDESEVIYRASGYEHFTYDQAGRTVSMRYWCCPLDDWKEMVPIAIETAFRNPSKRAKRNKNTPSLG